MPSHFSTESFTLESCVKARFLDSTRRRTGTLNTKCNTKNDTGEEKLEQHEPPIEKQKNMSVTSAKTSCATVQNVNHTFSISIM